MTITRLIHTIIFIAYTMTQKIKISSDNLCLVPKYKAKLRLRSYKFPLEEADPVFLEIKKESRRESI